MSQVLRLSILFVFITLGCKPERGSAQDATLSTTPAGRAMESFLAAYNTGDEETIRAFVEEAYEDSGSENSVGFWSAAYHELGPLSFRGSNEPGLFWCRGTVTGAWIGIRIRVSDESPRRIVSTAIRRVPLPPKLAAVRTAVLPEELADSLTVFLDKSAAGGHFSGAVIVARDGEPIFQKAYGFSDRTAGTLNTLDTRFKLASVSKMFTGVAILQLVDRGLLSLDDPIQRYIPEYPEHIGSQVTVEHLLTHTSGIELDNDPDFSATVVRARSIEDLLEAQLQYIERLNLGNYRDFEPLGSYDYTNEGIDLLGVLVERVSGQPWSEYLDTNVFAPAEMTSAGADNVSPVTVAKQYFLRGDTPGIYLSGERREVPADRGVAGLIRPAGTGYASATDMLRFMNALWGGEILGREYAESMASPQVVSMGGPESLATLGFRRWYGYTIDIFEYANGDRAIGHTGAGPGVGTAVYFYPESEMTVIILSNFDRGSWWVHQRIQEMLFGAGG